jgi:RNA polymerase sigma-70 factor (ECF subfamily)
LFTEGYHSSTHREAIRQELCEEAIYLGGMLCADKRTATAETHALMALMCLQASRIPARKAGPDYAVLYEEQDRKLWDAELVEQGVFHFQQSAGSATLTAYHLEAAIACQYAVTADSIEKWETLLQLYDWLLVMKPGPVVTLNRLYALSKISGTDAAIIAAEQAALPKDQYYHMLMGYLYQEKDKNMAIDHWENACQLASPASEKRRIREKLSSLQEQTNGKMP